MTNKIKLEKRLSLIKEMMEDNLKYQLNVIEGKNSWIILTYKKINQRIKEGLNNDLNLKDIHFNSLGEYQNSGNSVDLEIVKYCQMKKDYENLFGKEGKEK